MVFLIPILAPFLFPIAVGSNIMELLTGNVTLSGNFFQQFIGFWDLIFSTMSLWLV